MKNDRILFLALIMLPLLLCIGCTSRPVVVALEDPGISFEPAPVQPPNFNELEFNVTDANICLTGHEYEDLANNMSEVTRLLKEQQALILFYENLQTIGETK